VPTVVYIAIKDTLAIHYIIILLLSIGLPFIWKKILYG